VTSRLEVRLGGASLALLAAGAIHWAAHRCVIVADAHFGKAATFRARGIPVPQGTTRETLLRLQSLIEFTQSTAVVFLGDLFHAAEAHAPATLAELRVWREANRSLEVFLVEGNHDLRAGAPPSDLGIVVRQEPWTVDGLALCHHPQVVDDAYSLAGHLHPARPPDGAAGVRQLHRRSALRSRAGRPRRRHRRRPPLRNPVAARRRLTDGPS
jgi:DNA ligase-associated metallophosphoesterase